MSLIKVKSITRNTLGDELRPNLKPIIINGDMSVQELLKLVFTSCNTCDRN